MRRKSIYGLLAEFETPEALLAAARRTVKRASVVRTARNIA